MIALLFSPSLSSQRYFHAMIILLHAGCLRARIRPFMRSAAPEGAKSRKVRLIRLMAGCSSQ